MTLDDLVGLLREQQLAHDLQVVGVSNVPLHGVLDGVGAGEELLARLLLVSTGIGVHVLIEQLPHVVGQVQDLEVLGILESSLELLGDGAVEGGLLHDLADQPLLAVQVVVVELLVDILEHGDPGDDVQAIEESLVVGPILLLCIGIVLAVALLVRVPVVSEGGGECGGAAGKGDSGQSSDEHEGSQQDKSGGAVRRVEVEEPGSTVLLVHLVLFHGVAGASHGQEGAS